MQSSLKRHPSIQNSSSVSKSGANSAKSGANSAKSVVNSAKSGVNSAKSGNVLFVLLSVLTFCAFVTILVFQYQEVKFYQDEGLFPAESPLLYKRTEDYAPKPL